MEQENQDQSLQDSEPEVITERSNFATSFLGSNPRNELREELFYYWYNNRKLGAKKVYDKLEEDYPEADLPSRNTFALWIREYNYRAIELDRQVHQQLEEAVVAEKVEMLKRHASVGVVMQNMAIDYLQAHADDLTSAGAIRLLVEGVRIERDSKGIPEALEKMSKMSDDQLLEEVKRLATSSSVTLERWDADDSSS